MKTILQKTCLRLTGVALLLLFSNLVQAQSFQGTVIYLQDVGLSKAFLDMGVTKAMIVSKLQKEGSWGDTIKVTYDKMGDYRSILNSKKQPVTIYRSDVNKIYTFGDGKASEKVTVQDAVDLDLSGQPDKPELIKRDTAVMIKGVKCTALTVQWKMSRIDYYYNSNELNIDPALFSKHSADGWADYLKASKAIPFQIVKNVFGMTMIQTLVSSKSEPISPDLFSIPTLVADESLNVVKVPNMEVMRVKK